MTTTTARKRLDEIETYLAPKEWAIRVADEMRRYPSAVAHLKALVNLPLHDQLVQRPYFAFKEQAGKRYPGHKPDDIRARNRLIDELAGEFHRLKLLILQVNQTIQHKVERVGLEAALRLAALHALIQEDAFAYAATDAAVWIKANQPAGADAVRQGQTVLNQLAAFTAMGMGEAPIKSVPSQTALAGFPSPLEEWSHESTSLLTDFSAHRAAVELIQGEHFDGHPILYSNWETELAEVTRTIESAVGVANDYLNRQPERDGAGTNKGAGESNLAISLASIKASASGQRAADIAEKWLHDARFEAIESDSERWEQCRDEFGAKE